MGFSIVAIGVGAVMYWAATAQGQGFRLSTVGAIFMVVGVIGFVASLTVFSMFHGRQKGNRHHTYDRRAVGGQGRPTAVHEEVP
jgi:heme/copper-type cytochrome/quinol oxidase subunit 2